MVHLTALFWCHASANLQVFAQSDSASMDHHEMRRQLVGAVLMGLGGILASGCTIGQGLSAGSLLAPSWPFAALGLYAGARLGIAILIGGGLRAWWEHLHGESSPDQAR